MNKPLSIVLSLILFFSSIRVDYGSLLPIETDIQYASSCSTNSSWVTVFYPLPVAGETVIGSAPSHNNKIDPAIDYALAGSAFNWSMATGISQVLRHIRNQSPGLSISDIIFPFHYFW